MTLRRHLYACMAFCFALVSAGALEETGNRYVPDPALEALIESALDSSKAVAFPAIKRLSEIGAVAERALNNRLDYEKSYRTRVQLANILARCGEGRVGYRITVELAPDGSGRLVLESDRTMLAECARKNARLSGKPEPLFEDDELRRNPYSKVDLARYFGNGLKYDVGGTRESGGRIFARGELSFTNFDEFAAFATSFDKNGYHLISGVTLADNNDVRTLHFKKPAEANNELAAKYLHLFHDVKWEFVLDYKGAVQNSNATAMTGGRHSWRFNCSQMLTGEAEIEASFDPKKSASAPGAAASNPNTNPDPIENAASKFTRPAAKNAEPVALVANKLLSVVTARRYEKGVSNPNGPECVVHLDGRPSVPDSPDLRYQWVQTSGLSLNLPSEKLNVPELKMLIYEAGEYRFQLTVSLNDKIPAPAEVVVQVGDGAVPVPPPPPVVVESPKKEGGSTQKTIEMDFGEKPKAVREAVKDSFIASVKPIEQPIVAPPPQPAPSINKYAGVTIDTSASPLELIRQAEEEFAQGIAYEKPVIRIAPKIAPKVAMEEPKPVPSGTGKEIVAFTSGNDVTPAPPVPPIPQPLNPPPLATNQGSAVAVSGRIALNEIRQYEEEFNKAQKTIQPPPEPPVPVAPENTGVKNSDGKEKTIFVVPSANGQPVESVKNDVPEKIVVKNVVPVAPPVQPIVADKPVEPAPAVAEKPKADINQELQAFRDALNAAKNNAKTADAAPPVSTQETAKKSETPAPDTNKTSAVPQPKIELTGTPLEQGKQLMKAGQYAAAVDALKAVAQANPADEETQLQWGVAMVHAAEKADGYDRVGTRNALSKFEEIYEKNVKNVKALLWAGHCYARMENMQQAAAIYRQAANPKMGGEAVRWESKWQLGNKYNKAGEFANALDVLKTAQELAVKAGVKDARLSRDMALALHGLKKDNEAAKYAADVLAQDGALDPQLAAELKVSSAKTTEPVASVSPAEAGSKTVAGNDAAPSNPNVTNPNVGTKPVAGMSDMEKRLANMLDKGKPVNEVAVNTVKNPAVAPVEPAVPAVTGNNIATKPPEPVAVTPNPGAVKPVQPQVPHKTMKDLENESAEKIKPPEPRTPRNVQQVPPADVKVVKKALAVPERFEDAIAAGKRALERGLALQKAGNENKTQSLEAFDEAEAMFRGAWNQKPGDEEVVKNFEELAKQVGVIALVKSPAQLSKTRGLVVLSAEPSIVFPKDKTVYYAWEQVVTPEGPDLSLRRDDMAKKLVGLRIKDPGVYKFELVVSDGERGRNPVPVTVEVRE